MKWIFEEAQITRWFAWVSKRPPLVSAGRSLELAYAALDRAEREIAMLRGQCAVLLKKFTEGTHEVEASRLRVHQLEDTLNKMCDVHEQRELIIKHFVKCSDQQEDSEHFTWDCDLSLGWED